jgi:hypothetical protein
MALLLKRAMNTLRIVGFGILGVAAVLIVATIHLWREGESKKGGLKVLKEMTPERLIADCGHPTSDTEDFVHQGWAFTRSIEYRGTKSPYWVKLDFVRGSDKLWHLTHFASAEVGVSPSDDNAYIAIPVFPCMAKKAPYSSP